MTDLFARVLRGYRTTGVPRLEQQARDLADAARSDHEALVERVATMTNGWRPSARGYEVTEL